MTETRRLIKACIAGDESAQKQLYDTFAGQMLGVCYRYTKSMDDAQDVLQEGFINIFRNLHQYKEEGELGAWVRRIMVNAALNFLKQSKKYQSEMLMKEEYLHPVSDENPIIKLSVKEITALVRQLPAGYQAIFNLHAIEGYTHVQIAKMLGISEGTSRSQYMRARNLLLMWLEKYNLDSKTINYAG
ncbi:MAG: RNA polymerase sigma factor [Filimonas sp.]|nr:RNA polymerase sigma factor [Filimonas sp.]